MDNYDSKAIASLMANARISWAELGSLLGLSAPAAAERVRKLEEKGIIKGYAALVDPKEAGFGLGAFVSVTVEDAQYRRIFLELVAQAPEILECHHVAGVEDYILKVRCADTQELERLISGRIKNLPGIRTRTTVVLSTVKETPVLPVRF